MLMLVLVSPEGGGVVLTRLLCGQEEVGELSLAMRAGYRR